MSDTTQSPAPREGTGNPHAKIPAPKDRNCPYCHQAFTSSSLGRHLDLYIKPKNPKPPDGIHNVEEIRRIRGNITRRQARMSSAKKSQSLPSHTPTNLNSHERHRSITVDTSIPTHNSLTRSILGDQSQLIRSPSTGETSLRQSYGVLLNKPHWLATGVINDLPPREDPLQRVKSAPQEHATNGSDDVVSRWRSDLREAEKEVQARLLDQLDRGKAADLALREVLNSITEAKWVIPFSTLCLFAHFTAVHRIYFRLYSTESTPSSLTSHNSSSIYYPIHPPYSANSHFRVLTPGSWIRQIRSTTMPFNVSSMIASRSSVPNKNFRGVQAATIPPRKHQLTAPAPVPKNSDY